MSEIRDKKAVFSKGASRVELVLDYFRKIKAPILARAPTAQAGVAGAAPVLGQAALVSPVVPRVFPQLPRRERLLRRRTRSAGRPPPKEISLRVAPRTTLAFQQDHPHQCRNGA